MPAPPGAESPGAPALPLPYPVPLRGGRLIRRYKRFLADVDLPGIGTVVAHCANTGAMTGLTVPGSRVWLAANTNPAAKLDWRWEIASQMTPSGEALVGINTGRANHVVAAALQAGRIAELSAWPVIRREVPYGAGRRVDFLLQAPQDAARPDCYLEVKSVTLRRDTDDAKDSGHHKGTAAVPLAEFPDAPTSRGAGHLDSLAAMVDAGHAAAILYLVQRADCSGFRIAADIDPDYAAAAARAHGKGVMALCYICRVSPEGIDLGDAIGLLPSG